MKSRNLLFVFVATILLSSCSGDSSEPGKGELSINLTDAPVQQADAVVIYFETALVNSSVDGRVEVDVIDPDTMLPGRSVDLLQLTGDRTIELITETFTEGRINWIRLMVDFDPEKTYIQIDGIKYPLRCVSCEKNGLKVNNSFEVFAGTTNYYTLDFDLHKSIAHPHAAGIDYILRPTIRVVQTDMSGSIRGTVDETVIASLEGSECAVYVYDGHDSTTDDIYMPDNMPVPDTHNNPVMATMVEYNMATSQYEYHAAFLPAGPYTIALTCDAIFDDPMTDDSGINFYGTVNKSVTAGQTTIHNFVPLP